MPETPKLSIIVTSYRNPELLKLCLQSIRRHTTGVTYELLVADSATEEPTELLMREEFSDVKFLPYRDNVGLARLLETGVAESSGRYILYMNGDIVVTPGSIEGMLAYFEAHPEIGLLGPQLLNFNETFQYSCFRFYRPITILYRRMQWLPFAKKHLDWFLMKEYDHRVPRTVDWLMGSMLLTSRAAVEGVGTMDTRFFLYMEDVDWCRRFWKAGYKVVYYPFVKVYHYHGKGSARGGVLRSLLFNRLTWYHLASAVKYFWRYRSESLPDTDGKKSEYQE